MYLSNTLERFDGSRVYDYYLNDLNKYAKRISPDKEVSLFYKYHKEGDEAAKVEFINANLLFVVRVAKKYRNFGLPMEDLISEGNMGLLRAFEKFDPTRGFKFITFAVSWIQAFILKALSEKKDNIKIPIGMQEFISKMEKESKKFFCIYERYPLPDELSEILNEDLDKIILLQDLSKGTTSFDYYYGLEDQGSLLDTIPDYTFKTDKIFDNELLEYRFERMIRHLNPKHKIIIQNHFSDNFDSTAGDTLKKLGKELTPENFQKLEETRRYILSRMKKGKKIRA